MGTMIRDARPEDIPEIEAMRIRECKDLGFVPRTRYEHILHRTEDPKGYRPWIYERILVSESSSGLAGFLYGSVAGPVVARIFQVCVRREARRQRRAVRLAAAFERIARQYGVLGVRCRVAECADANFFWTAAGYAQIGRAPATAHNRRQSKSGRMLVVYEKPFATNWLPFQSPTPEPQSLIPNP